MMSSVTPGLPQNSVATSGATPLPGAAASTPASHPPAQDTTPSATDTPAAIRAGADLRAARERLGWTLDTVVAATRIRRVHLQALEDGRLADLPSHAYALAFIRSYAATLGLDSEEAVRRFKTESGETAVRPELVFPTPVPERGLPSGAIVLLGLVLCVGAYAGWYRLSAEGRLPAETVMPVPERLAPLADQAIPPPVPVQPAAPPTALADAATPRATGTTAPPPMAISPTSAAAASVQPLPDGNPTQAVAATLEPGLMAETGAPQTDSAPTTLASTLAPTDTPATAPPATADDSRIVLRANAPAWLLVKDRNGAVLLNRTLQPGETWTVPPRSGLLLTTGNAGGTEILVDGTLTAGLGGSGVVRRDLPLDPDQIRDGRLAAVTNTQLASPTPHQ